MTNAGWIESNSANGMRKCLAEEFSSIYVFHLKGNQRTSGEQSRKEGGKVFGEGSRAPVAITLFVKNPDDKVKGKIYFHAVDDYLSREEKLAQVRESASVLNLPVNLINPDQHGDWMNQRDDSFSHFMRLDGKNTTQQAIFKNYSNGVKTNRDAWCYNSSNQQLERNLRTCIANYNSQVNQALADTNFTPNLDPKLLSWSTPQKTGIEKGVKADGFTSSKVYTSVYRPFIKQKLYYDRFWNERVYQMPKIFPKQDSRNLVICVSGIGNDEFSVMIANSVTELQLLKNSQCFPRYVYEADKDLQPQADLFANSESTGRKDGITNEAISHFEEAYSGHTISVDDLFYYIYGILHSEDYRLRYANNLMKELPRIPRVATYEQFMAFSEAGRKLADLHVNYEEQPEYAGVMIKEAPGASYRVSQMKYGKIKGKKGNDAKDKTMIIYNDDITIMNIPLEAQEYVVNKKSALDWILDKARVKTDKDSGIVNDFNDYGLEMTPPNPRYPLSLVLKVITVSLETMKIVKSLPPLEIHPLDKA